jgi:hypothetical protein
MSKRWGGAAAGRATLRATLASLALVVAYTGCGDDDSGGAAAAGGGCTTDVECKGDRICMAGACVDPETGEPDGASGSGAIEPGDGGSEPGSDAGTPAGGGGAGGSSSAGRGGTGSRPVIDDPALEEACSLNCEARKAAECEMDIGSLDQCNAQCLIADEVNNGYCLDEQRAQYACLASGGYACIQGYPQQKATCTSETLALSQCHQGAPCRTFCEQAAGVCAPDGDACITACDDMQNGFDEAFCSIHYMQLLSCWNRNGACDGDRPTVQPCLAEVSEVADCLGRRTHECDGYCWAADQLGCGASDCVETCMARADEVSCGSYYRRIIDCTIGSRQIGFACEDGEPEPDAVLCGSDIMQWQTCTQNM